MKDQHVPSRLDLLSLVRSASQLAGRDPLRRFARLAQESPELGAGATVQWSASAQERADGQGQPQIWLHLKAQAALPLTCQRCLEAVDTQLLVDRSFRFVASEQIAEEQDDEAQEDLLVFEGEFDLHQLLEDELLLALPLIARHASCPAEPALSVVDADFVSPSPGPASPFAVLASLKAGPTGKAG